MVGMASRRATRLRFGAYRPPRFQLRQHVACLARGTVRVVAIREAPVQWPTGALSGVKSLSGGRTLGVERTKEEH